MMQLRNCPPGLFWFNGTLGFKSEYKTESMSSPGVWQSDAYVVASGEYFWGGVSDAEKRERMLVEPIDDADVLSALSTPAPQALMRRLWPYWFAFIALGAVVVVGLWLMGVEL